MIPPWALPYLIGGGVVLAVTAGGFIWHRTTVAEAVKVAVKDCNDEWEIEAARLRLVAADEARAHQSGVNAADLAANAARTALSAGKRAGDLEGDTHYAQTGNDGPCLDAGRLRAIEAARAAGMAAANATD